MMNYILEDKRLKPQNAPGLKKNILIKPPFQENYSTPPEHTTGNPHSQLWKESLYILLVKV